MNVAIIGLGYWGSNILRVLSNNTNINIKYLCDVNNNNIEKYKDHYQTTNDYINILNDSTISLVFIITPISTHYKIIIDCIENNKHVYVAKPICKTMNELNAIITSSNRHNVKVFCDYTFNYSDKIDTLKKTIGNPNNILFIEVNRDTHRMFHNDNIIFDLLPHDLTILYKLLNTSNIKINFIDKVTHDNLIIKNSTYFNIENIKGVINTSFISEKKNRKIKIICNDKIILYDDTSDIIDVLYYEIIKTEFQLSQKNTSHDKIVSINYTEPIAKSIIDCINMITTNDTEPYNKLIELNKNIVKFIQEIDNL
jgi:predicted dehydrogenase